MYQSVIDFWFNQLEQKQWFIKDTELDNLIRQKFESIHRQARQGELEHWRQSAEGALAEIILLDQFSRNIYRDTAKAFAFDGLALVLAQEAIRRELDNQLSEQQRAFLYMPFMHSESKLIHQTAVELYTRLGNPVNLEFEMKHKKIIDRFARYPHRNAILGRESCAEEIEFLNQPGSAF